MIVMFVAFGVMVIVFLVFMLIYNNITRGSLFVMMAVVVLVNRDGFDDYYFYTWQ